jgi:hypothetical protein
MKVIAFYLPQFHCIPENDQWWGKGFTEWTNVKKAQPLFPNHRQPRIPLHDNYYDLSHVDVLRWQAELARKYKVYGFCFYHYWFNGKLLLEKPMEILLANPDIDLNYCISWANENWTDGWVSDENKLLVGHDFDDEEDWLDHFYYLLKFFRDPRYIKEQGKPLLAIYVPNHIPKLKKMLDLWSKLALENGLLGIKYIYQHPSTYFDKSMDLSSFDYGIEFQPQFDVMASKSAFKRQIYVHAPKISGWIQRNLGVYIKIFRRSKDATIIDYSEAWSRILRRPPGRSNLIPTAFVDWDNTPRKAERGTVYEGASPQKFDMFFNALALKAKSEYPTDMIFVFAWNEWAEGGYLEPDTDNSYGYLEAILRTLNEI